MECSPVPAPPPPPPQGMAEQGTDAWFNARKRKVTASVVAALFGASKFTNLHDAGRTLRGERSFFGNLATSWGSTMEDVARDRYIELMGVKVSETGFHPWTERMHRGRVIAGGSPDGLVSDARDTSPSQSSSRLGILEIKCPHSSRRPVKLGACMHYMYQVQFNMVVTNRSFGDFVSYTPAAISVERVPLASSVRVGTLGFSQEKLKEFERDQMYDSERGTWPGYADALARVIATFYDVSIEGPHNNWDDWKFRNDQYIAIVVRLHDALKAGGHIKHFFTREMDMPLPPRLLPRTVAWTAMMLWQMRAIAADLTPAKNQGKLHRFAIVRYTPGGPPAVTHWRELDMQWSRPPWFSYTGVCVDILSGATYKTCKKLDLLFKPGQRQAVSYGPFGARRLPQHGVVVTTFFRDGIVVGAGKGAWDLTPPAHAGSGGPESLGGLRRIAPYVDVALNSDATLRVDLDHTAVTLMMNDATVTARP